MKRVMRPRTLLTQVLAVNSLLVAPRPSSPRSSHATAQGRRSAEGLLLLALAVFSAVLLNSLLIRYRLEPMDRLVRTMDQVDLTPPACAPTPRPRVRRGPEASAGFNRMLDRLEEERRQAGRAVLRGQETSARGSPRTSTTRSTRRSPASCCGSKRRRWTRRRAAAPSCRRPSARQPGDGGAAAPRPPAAPDRARRPRPDRPRSPRRSRTSRAPGIDARFSRHGDMPTLTDEEQLVIYRVTQESLSNIAQRAGARHVSVQLSFVGRTILRITDDGKGFDPGPATPAATAGRAGASADSGSRACASARCSWAETSPSTRRRERAPPSNSPWERHEDPHRRRPRHRPWRPAPAHRPPARHGGRGRGRGRRGRLEQALRSVPTSACSTSRCRA